MSETTNDDESRLPNSWSGTLGWACTFKAAAMGAAFGGPLGAIAAGAAYHYGWGKVTGTSPLQGLIGMIKGQDGPK